MTNDLQAKLQDSIAGCTPPVGLGLELLEDERVSASLASVPHLGSLSDMVSVSASRLDYVRLWADVLGKIKRSYPGLGLSGPYNPTRENSLSKLEILQSWAILANCGHLYHTFSTERALLYILAQNPSHRREFLGFLGPLRKIEDAATLVSECTRIVTRADYLSFFYVLAAWRLFVGDLKGIGPKRKVRSVWQEFFSSRRAGTDQGRMMHWLFKKSRQVVTSYIHSLMQIGPSTTTDMDGLIQEMFHKEYIMGYSSGLAETDVSRHLEQLQALHLRVFFSSPDANKRTLSDMRAAKRWWERRRDVPFADRVSAMFHEMDDWPHVETSSLPPFSRIFIPVSEPREMWLQEVERWKEMGWEHGEFVISQVGLSGLACDLYMERTAPDLPAISKAMRVMAWKLDSWRGGDEDSRRRMEASIASFGVQLLTSVGNERGVINLRPMSMTKQNGCGLVVLASSMNMAKADVRGVAGSLEDEARGRELDWFFQYGDRVGSSVDNDEIQAVLVFLGRVVLLEDENEVTDLDLVVGEFYSQCVVWTICQLKEGVQSKGGQQLEKVRDYFPGLGPIERMPNSGKTKCWLARVVQGNV